MPSLIRHKLKKAPSFIRHLMLVPVLRDRWINPLDPALDGAYDLEFFAADDIVDV